MLKRSPQKHARRAQWDEGCTKDLAWQRLGYRHDYRSPRKGSKYTKQAPRKQVHRLVCLHLIPYLRELGTIQARIKPGADASHTMSPAIACFHHGHESASYHE